MVLIVFAGALLCFALGIMLRPFFMSKNVAPTNNRESTIYQDQLNEVDRDRARGVITDEQASAAKNEIERRLLGALRRQDEHGQDVSRTGRMAMIVSIAALPLAAGLLYYQLGSPAMPDQPYKSRNTATEAMAAAPGTHAEMRARIAALEQKLEANPDDVEGQALLARSYASIGDYGSALDAYVTANRQTEGRDRRLAGEYAEVMVLASDGIVPESAATIFALIQEEVPNDPQAIYYLALFKAQNGDEEGALRDLVALRDSAPAQAPFMATVNGLITQLSPNSSAPVPPTPTRRPTAEQMAAAEQMSAEDRAAMINNMVEGLAARLQTNPDDVEGWRRLARAYEVLGERDKAAAAHRQVIERVPNDPAANAFLDQ